MGTGQGQVEQGTGTGHLAGCTPGPLVATLTITPIATKIVVIAFFMSLFSFLVSGFIRLVACCSEGDVIVISLIFIRPHVSAPARGAVLTAGKHRLTRNVGPLFRGEDCMVAVAVV